MRMTFEYLKTNDNDYLLHSTIHYIVLNIQSCLPKNRCDHKNTLLAAVLWLFVSVVDVVKDVLLTINHQRLPGHTYKRDTTKTKIQILNEIINTKENDDTIHTKLKRGSLSSVRLTSDPKWSNGVLVECETLFQGMSSHGLIKDITASEVQNPTVVLILGNQPSKELRMDRQGTEKTRQISRTKNALLCFKNSD